MLFRSKDIQNIENGNTSPQAVTGGLMARLDELRFQIHQTKNPNGNSWLQRLEYWKTGWSVIKENALIGVGIGDVDQALSYKYKALNSPLELKNRKRCHNMFLTTWLGVGILGTVILLSILITLFLIGIQMKNPLLISFVFISGITMLFEDQLETQAGASFFGFFIIILGCRVTQNIWRLKN